MPVPFLTAVAPFIGPALGFLGNLFKGKKTKFTEQQSPQQKLAYTQLLQMLMRKNLQGSDPMNQVRQMFYGQQPPQQPLVGMPDNSGSRGIPPWGMGGRERPLA